MNITLAGTKVSMDGHTLAFQKNNLVDSMVITVDTDETWQYKLDVKYPCKDSDGKELYNVIDLTRVGNTCTAILQASMLPFNGKYTMQLRGISDDKVYHTDTFDVWVKYSIDPGKVYDPVPSEFYQIESNITSMNNHPPKPGDNGYWLVWNVPKQEYEESDIPLPEGTLPEVSDSTNGWYLTNDGERVYWAEVQGGSGEGDITAIQVNGINQPIVDKVAKLTIGKDTVGLGNLDNVQQYSSVNQPPYPVTSVNGQTGAVTINTDGKVTSVNGQTGDVVLNAESVGALPSTTKIPSATSDLTNDSGYITAAGAPVQSVAGKTGAVTLTKADVGLSNVDNTSDANKPISAATQTALNGKLDKTEVVDVTADAIKGQAADAKSIYDVIQALPTGTDLSLGLTAAKVGQTVKVKAVDADGKPTEWEAVDIAGGETWEKIAEIELRADTAEYVLADFATWRKAKVIMTRPKYISGLDKNVWCKVVWNSTDNAYNCGYITIGYGYVFWEFAAEVNELCITSESIENNNIGVATYVKSRGTLTPLKAPIENHKFELLFTDTSVIQDGDKVTVIGVRR